MQNDSWQAALVKISQTLDVQRFESWIKPLVLLPQTNPGNISFGVPNKFMIAFIEQHYGDLLTKTLRSIDSSIESIGFVANPNIKAAIDEPVLTSTQAQVAVISNKTIRATPVQKISISSRVDKRFTFNSFVVGSGNEFAKSAAFSVAQSPGKTKFNPLLIYSGVGLGKTHLLHAIGNYIESQPDKNKVVYLSSEEFYLNFIDAIKNNNTRFFTDFFRSADALLMDDVQFFSGKESTQEEFFYIFNALYQAGKQIVLTSDLPPNLIKGLQDRLISRFHWGLCVDIQPPDFETRIAILKKKSEEQKLNIPECALVYIAENISSNIRLLEGAVIRLLAYSSITKIDLSLDVVKEVLKNSTKNTKSKITIDTIIEKVSEYYNVPVNNMREKNRRKEVAHSRQIAMYISKQCTDFSLKTIGLNFGGRDHSTVIHAINNISVLMKTNISVSKDVNFLMSSL